MMIGICAPHFTAAVLLKDGVVVKTAPILHYMKGWTQNLVVSYCVRRNFIYLIFREEM